MKKLVVLLALLASVAALAAYEAVAQVKEGEENEIIFRKKWNEFGIQGNILNAIFTPDESKILLSAEDKFLELDANTGIIIREIPGIYGAKQFSEDGEFFYTYDRKKVRYSTMEIIGRYEDEFPDTWTIKDFVVDEKYGLYIMIVEHAKSSISTPNDPRLLKSIFVYDLNTFKLKKVTGMPDHYVGGINISPTENYFLIASRYDPNVTIEGDERDTLSLWDKVSLNRIGIKQEFLGHTCFSPDGKWIAVTQSNMVRLYDVKSFEKKWEKQQQNSTFGILNAITFSKDSKYLATGGPDYDDVSNIHIWNVETGELEKRYYDIGGTPQQRIEFNSNYRILGSHQSVIGLFGSKFKSFTEPQKQKILTNYDNNKLFIHLPLEEPYPTTIDIFNSTGGRVSNLYKGINQKDYVFDLSKFSKGIYFLKVNINNEIFSEKFIKE